MISIYSSKTWGSVNVRQTCLEHVTEIALTIVRSIVSTQYFIEEWVVGGVRKCFANDFLQLTYSLSAFFLTWYCCVIVLNFAKNVFFYFHIEIPLVMGDKLNVYKTYVCSIYVLFPGGCAEASKPVLWSKAYGIITCWKSTINALKQDEKSVKLSK